MLAGGQDHAPEFGILWSVYLCIFDGRCRSDQLTVAQNITPPQGGGVTDAARTGRSVRLVGVRPRRYARRGKTRQFVQVLRAIPPGLAQLQALGLDLPNQPDLAADPAIAARIATWYWQSRPGLAEAGRAGDVKAATRRINGGDNGLSDRKEKFARYLREVQAGLPQPAGTPVARAQPGQPPAAAGPAGSLSAITTRPAPGAPEAATLGQLQSMLSQLDDMVCRLSAVQPATREAEAGQLAAAVNHANQLTARRS